MRRVEVGIGPGWIHAEARRGRQVVARAEAAWETAADLEARVRELGDLEALRCHGPRLRLELAVPIVQVRRLEQLPRMSQSALVRMLARHSHRWFRRNGVGVVVNARWLRARGTRTTAVAAAAPEPVIMSLLQGARDAGFRVTGICPAHSEGRKLDLLPVKEREHRDRLRMRHAARVAALGATLWLATGAVYVWRASRADRLARAELTELAPAVAAIERLRAQVDSASATLGALDESYARSGGAASTAIRLTASLPDSVVLVHLAVDSTGGGRMSGLAPRALDVIARLESEGFVAPRLEGDPLPETESGVRRERFTLRFVRWAK